MADEGHAGASRETPRDPMWATFRAEHPEVTLVLLPDPPPLEADALDADAGAQPAFDDAAERVSLEQARAEFESLERKLALIAEMMKCAHTDPTGGGWQSRGDTHIRPQLQLRAPATESTPSDAEVIAARLRQLGWRANVKPSTTAAWVEGDGATALVTVTVIEGIVTVRMTGTVIAVDPADAERLSGTTDG